MINLINSDARWVRWATFAVSILLGAAVWEFAGRNANPVFMAPLIGNAQSPGAALSLINFIGDSQFRGAFLSSLKLFATGFALALVIAVPLGLILARLMLLRVALESYILVLYVTPMVALIPFILSILGFGFWPKVLVVVLFTLFPVLYNTLEGARSVKPELLEVAGSFRASEWSIWRDVLIPYTLPFALTGIRQATGRALVGMIAAEFFLSTSGLGEVIVIASRTPDMASMLAAIVLIAVFGVILMRGAQALEHRYSAWRGVDR
ncbi:MAG: ABC transporter permease subunit [Betaproteobacteria bacterium]|nr:ABC transporter permease subunit [Betaproteobacteria bacterium]